MDVSSDEHTFPQISRRDIAKRTAKKQEEALIDHTSKLVNQDHNYVYSKLDSFLRELKIKQPYLGGNDAESFLIQDGKLHKKLLASGKVEPVDGIRMFWNEHRYLIANEFSKDKDKQRIQNTKVFCEIQRIIKKNDEDNQNVLSKHFRYKNSYSKVYLDITREFFLYCGFAVSTKREKEYVQKNDLIDMYIPDPFNYKKLILKESDGLAFSERMNEIHWKMIFYLLSLYHNSTEQDGVVTVNMGKYAEHFGLKSTARKTHRQLIESLAMRVFPVKEDDGSTSFYQFINNVKVNKDHTLRVRLVKENADRGLSQLMVATSSSILQLGEGYLLRWIELKKMTASSVGKKSTLALTDVFSALHIHSERIDNKKASLKKFLISLKKKRLIQDFDIAKKELIIQE